MSTSTLQKSAMPNPDDVRRDLENVPLPEELDRCPGAKGAFLFSHCPRCGAPLGRSFEVRFYVDDGFDFCRDEGKLVPKYEPSFAYELQGQGGLDPWICVSCLADVEVKP